MIQFSLDTHQSDQSLLCALRATKDHNFLNADSEYSDQTGLMHRHILGFLQKTIKSKKKDLILFSKSHNVFTDNLPPSWICTAQQKLSTDE